MKIAKRITIVVLGVLLIPASAVLTTAAKQRFADGPGIFFSGSPAPPYSP